MKFLHKLITKIEPPNWVMAIITGVIVLRIPSLFEPYYYGDEMIYLTLGNAIRKGITLYSQIHDNKPPLLYVTAAVAGNLFWFKAILMFWMLATIIIFWHLSEELFKNSLPTQAGKLAQKISVAIFAILTTLPLFEGNIANAELFLIGPIILGILILLKNPSNKNIFLAGLSFAVATLFKVPAIFDVPVIVVFWLISLKDINFKDILEVTKKTLILAAGLAIPIVLTLIWYFLKGAGSDYVKAAFLQNIGYLSSWSGGPKVSFVTKNGPLLIRAGVVLIGFIALRVYNRRLSKPFLISSIWLLTSLFAATLSARPYPHYLIQAAPAISILIAILVTSPKLEQVITILPLTLAVIVPVYYHFWYYSTSTYYERFLGFATHQISKEAYFNKFNSQTTNNYKTSQKIQNLVMPNDKMFVWGEDAPVIYALSRRLPAIKYAANYHITDFSSTSEVLKQLKANPPSLIVILSNSPKFEGLPNLLSSKYVKLESVGAEIWHLLAH